MKYPNAILALEFDLRAIETEINEKEPVVPFELLRRRNEFRMAIKKLKWI